MIALIYNLLIRLYNRITETMIPLKITIPDNTNRMFVFDCDLFNIKDFYDCKTSFTNDESYRGKTFMSQSRNIYYKVLHRQPIDTDLYQIPNRQQFIDSLSTMTADSFVVKISFHDMSLIYVAPDNSLYVNKICATCCTQTEFMEYKFVPLPDKSFEFTFIPKPAK